MNNWARTNLEQVIIFIRGITFPSQDKKLEPHPGHLVCLRTANVQKEVDWDNLWYVPSKYLRNQNQLIAVNDILLSSANSVELLGKSAIVREVPISATLGTFIVLLRPWGQIPAKFIYYFLLTRRFLDDVKANASTTTNISNISVGKLECINIPLPPLAEQHRVVAKIEELFSDLEEGIASLNTAKVQLKTYQQSVLMNGTQGRLIGNDTLTRKEIRWIKLETKIERPQYGTSKKCTHEETPWPVLRIPNIGSIRVDRSDLKYATFDRDEIESLKLEVGDLLIIRSNGSPSIVGKCSVIRKSELNCLYAGYLIRLRPKKNELNSNFLYYVLNSPRLREQIETKAKSTSGVNNINTGEIGSLLIPDLSLDDQIRIASEIESRLSEADNLEKTLDAALAQAESLRQSILKQAFEGKLVPQDPNDEPAEKLLERIRAERAANAEAPRKRGRYGGGDAPAKAGMNGTPVEGGAPKPRRGRPPGKKATAAAKGKRRG